MNEIQRKVFEQIDANWDAQLSFLQEVGRFRSTLGHERDLQQFIANYFKTKLHLDVDSFSIDAERLKKHPSFIQTNWSYNDRPIVVGVAKATFPPIGKSLILQSHIDVVSPEPTSHWQVDPWSSTIRGERMYGRGIQDMKSGLSAIVFAYQGIREAGVELGADVLLQSVIEEECTGNGALAALDRGYTADGALIPEPFGLQAVTSQVGVLWVRIDVTGAGAHTERADRAVNPIEKSYIVIEAIQQYRAFINNREKHPSFQHHNHPLNVNIGTIRSGDWPSSVPTKCSLDVRIGFYPNQDLEEIKREFEAWIKEALKDDEWLSKHQPTFTYHGFSARGVDISEQEPLLQTLSSVHEHVHHEKMKTTAITATTDIRTYILDYGIPATCYGPIGDGMHGVDEWVDLPSVKAVTKTYAAFMLEWCGVSK